MVLTACTNAGINEKYVGKEIEEINVPESNLTKFRVTSNGEGFSTKVFKRMTFGSQYVLYSANAVFTFAL